MKKKRNDELPPEFNTQERLREKIEMNIYLFFKKLVDHKLLLFFLLFVFLYRLYYLNYFYIPISDFFSFRFDVLKWSSFDLPTFYKRLPLYSWMIGIGHLILPNNHNSILYTAEIINLVLSIVSLGLIYLISSRFLKKFAFLVVFFVALSPQSVYLTCQPILEILLLTTILATIYLDIKNDKKSYFFAFLASMTRYEGFMLIPILVLKDLIYSKRKVLPIVLGFLSSMGMIVWITLSYFHSTDINPYVQDIIATGMVGPKFIKTCAKALLFFNSSGYFLMNLAIIIFAFILMTIGLYCFLKKSSKELFTILLFLISYIAMHIVFSSNVIRYVYPILWIFILFAVGGIEHVYGIIYEQNVFFNKKRTSDSFFVSGALIFSALIFLISIYFFKMLNGYFSFIIYLAYITCIGLFMYSIFREKKIKKIFFVSSVILIFCVLTGFCICGTQELMDSSKYDKAPFRLIGEWYTQNAKADDKMLTTAPPIVSYYTNLSYDENFVQLSSLNCDSPDPACFISELKKRNITYVAWDSHYGTYPNSSTSNYYKVYLISNLSEGRSTEHFRFIKKLEIGSQNALIYKFIPLDSGLNSNQITN